MEKSNKTSKSINVFVIFFIVSINTISAEFSFNTKEAKHDLAFNKYKMENTLTTSNVGTIEVLSRVLRDTKNSTLPAEESDLDQDNTTNPAFITLVKEKQNSDKLIKDNKTITTIAQGPSTYANENSYPRKFWPDLNPEAAIYACLLTTIWLTVSFAYLYIRFTGRSYEGLFNEPAASDHGTVESVIPLNGNKNDSSDEQFEMGSKDHESENKNASEKVQNQDI